MKAWRKHVRGLALVNLRDRPVEVFDNPFTIDGFDGKNFVCQGWPMLLGTQDQLPQSHFLQRLNGFSGPRPHPLRETVYFGVASAFNFQHGAPNQSLSFGHSWKSICEWALPQVPNDLVVPTASVYQPAQGTDSCGRFPLHPKRLMVLHPSCNATHTGLFRLNAVRHRIMNWLNVGFMP